LRRHSKIFLGCALALGVAACGSDPAPTGWNCNDNSPGAGAASCICVNSPVSTNSGACPYTTCCIMSSQSGSNFCECFDATFLAAFGNTCQERLNIREGEGYANVYFVSKCPP